MYPNNNNHNNKIVAPSEWIVVEVVRNVVTDPNSAGPCHHRQCRLHQLQYLMLLFRGHFKLADSMHVIAATVAVNVDRRDVLRGKGVYSVGNPTHD